MLIVYTKILQVVSGSEKIPPGSVLRQQKRELDLEGFVWRSTSGRFNSTIPEPLCDIFSSRYSLTVLRTVTSHGFYRATHMHSADYAVARCLSVCPSVSLSVCHRPVFCGHRWTYPQNFVTSSSPTILGFFQTKRDGHILTGTPLLTAASNTRRVWKKSRFSTKLLAFCLNDAT